MIPYSQKPHRLRRKGVQGAKPPVGVWGVPKNFFSLAAAGGESLRAIKLSLNKKGNNHG